MVTMKEIDALRGVAEVRIYEHRQLIRRRDQAHYALLQADLVDDSEECLTSAGLYVQYHREEKDAANAVDQIERLIESRLREWWAQGCQEVA